MKRKKIDLEKEKPVRPEPDMDDTPQPLRGYSGESPNRVVMPRKIGKRRPEEERGYKPLVF